jgi:hypothetical protein
LVWRGTPQGRTFRYAGAHGPRTADARLTHSPHSRTEAIQSIEPILEEAIRSKRRVLLSFDFAYGYPVDFAPAVQAATGKSDRDLPWITAWQYLSEHLKDDEGTTLGARPSNRSNRFAVADRINVLLSPDAEKTGPFWCASEGAARQYIPQMRPPEPFHTAQGYLVKGLRLTDKRARSGSPFRLFGTASGSQSLAGIARLHRLRNDARFAAVSAVWPFETGWAAKAKWLPARILILHAEMYPSVRDPLPDEIKDRGQVRVSPLLANLFLHYAFDKWMARTFRTFHLSDTRTTSSVTAKAPTRRRHCGARLRIALRPAS